MIFFSSHIKKDLRRTSLDTLATEWGILATECKNVLETERAKENRTSWNFDLRAYQAMTKIWRRCPAGRMCPRQKVTQRGSPGRPSLAHALPHPQVRRPVRFTLQSQLAASLVEWCLLLLHLSLAARTPTPTRSTATTSLPYSPYKRGTARRPFGERHGREKFHIKWWLSEDEMSSPWPYFERVNVWHVVLGECVQASGICSILF